MGPRLLHLGEDNLFLQALPVHPALRMDPYEPILDSWDTPEVFPHVLFAEVADWNFSTIKIAYADTKEVLG